MPSRLPDFLGIGTQKGGTTSLHQWLSRQPQVFLPKCKEVHYFDLNSHRTINWYENKFKNSNELQKCGEITPFYLYHPEVPARIWKAIPRVKMIVLLRDPVERALSQVFHAKKRGFENLDIREAIGAEATRLKSGDLLTMQRNSYVGRSQYLEQLRRYEELFPQNQILILKSEDIFAGRKESWQKIQHFLELEDTIDIGTLPVTNKGGYEYKTIAENGRGELREKLKATAIGVRKRYGFGWDWA